MISINLFCPKGKIRSDFSKMELILSSSSSAFNAKVAQNMGKRVIKVLQENGIDCLPNQRFSLDVDMFPQGGSEAFFPNAALFEEPKLNSGKRLIEDHGASFFRFFLDGAQRSYRVIEASISGHYLPFCAGQVGVAVLERNNNGRFTTVEKLTTVQNVLAIPNLVPEDSASDLSEQINAELCEKHHFKIIRYDYSSKEDKDPGDLGRAMIIDTMQRLELQTIRAMIQRNMISDRAMLAKDGGLQYRHDKIKDLQLSKDDIVQLRNVIGLAKTFEPSLTLGKGRNRQSLGNITKGLQWRERTTVIRPPDNKDTTYGWWYLRLRPTDWMYSPLQGIIKIEVFAMGEEKEDGISQSRADTISSYVLAERNVTPYKTDARWATHIYPIFLTETYLRSSFLSHTRFKSLIF